MEKTNVQNLAKILKILVTITFVCNLVLLPMVPGIVGIGAEYGLWGAVEELGMFGPEFGPAFFLAVCCFAISGAALVRAVWQLVYFHSPVSLCSYNTFFVPIFAMGGLLCMVMSALFRQAAQMKEENDLTI